MLISSGIYNSSQNALLTFKHQNHKMFVFFNDCCLKFLLLPVGGVLVLQIKSHRFRFCFDFLLFFSPSLTQLSRCILNYFVTVYRTSQNRGAVIRSEKGREHSEVPSNTPQSWHTATELWRVLWTMMVIHSAQFVWNSFIVDV